MPTGRPDDNRRPHGERTPPLTTSEFSPPSAASSRPRLFRQTFARLYRHKYTNLLRAAVLQLLLATAGVYILTESFELVLLLSNQNNLNQSNIGAILTNPLGLAALFLYFICLTFLMFLEYTVLIQTVSGHHTGAPQTVRQILGTVFRRLKGMLGPQLPCFILYLILGIPAINLGLSSALTEKLYIPRFITGELSKTTGGKIGLAAALLGLSYLNLRFIFALPLTILKGGSFTRNLRESWRITRRGKWRLIRTLAVFTLALSAAAALSALAIVLPLNTIDPDGSRLWLHAAFLTLIRGIFFLTLVAGKIGGIDILLQCLPAGSAAPGAAAGSDAGSDIAAPANPEHAPDTAPAAGSTAGSDTGSTADLTAAPATGSDDTARTGKTAVPDTVARPGETAAPAKQAGRRRPLSPAERRARPRLIALAAVAAAAALAFNAFQLYTIEHNPNILIVAHRGDTTRAVENSIEALEAAARSGADYVEMDILLTKDHRFVVMHDYNLKRLAGIDRRVQDMTFDEVVGLPIRQNGFSSTIPSFEAYVEKAKALGIKLLVELKPHGAEPPNYTDLFIEKMRSLGVATAYKCMSLDLAVMETINRKAPEMDTGYVIPIQFGPFPNSGVDFFGIEDFSYSDWLALQGEAMGKPVMVWTINEPETMAAYFQRPVSAIITDDPALARQVQAETAADSSYFSRLIGLLNGR